MAFVFSSVIALLALAFGAQIQAGIPAWTLSPTPTLTIEDVGTPAKEFVRIVGVARLSGGRIAVANRGTNDIRIFDAQGKHLTTFGRTGGGPGEFRRLEMISKAGDTVWFHDSGLERVSAIVLGQKPELATTTRITATGGQRFFVSGRLPDGRFVVSTPVSPTFDGPPGVHRLPGSIGIIAKNGEGQVNWLGTYRNAAIFAHSPTSDIKDGATGPIAFSPWLQAATGGGQVWIGDSAGDSLVVVRARDLSRFIVRVPIASRAPSRALVNEGRDEELKGNISPAGKAFTEAKYGKYLPERLPYFGSLIPGPQGELWIQVYMADRKSAVQYVVLDSAGRARGQVSVPKGCRIREVGLDYVLLVSENDDGVESVRLHRLDRVRD